MQRLNFAVLLLKKIIYLILRGRKILF